jgi:putative oxidoreductase
MNLKKFLQPSWQPMSLSIALLLMRLLVGFAFVIHGWGKIQTPFSWMPAEAGVPAVLQFLAAIAEFGGGVALILGLLLPVAVIGIAVTMVVATIFVAVKMKAPFISQSGGLSFELSSVYLFVAILLLFAGAGRLSLDALIFGTRAPRPFSED